jgi:hypothetical protein
MILIMGTPLCVHAATDGALGATSSGDSNVTLTIPKLVRISSITNFDFGNYDGASDPASLNSDTCVWTNDTAGEYTVNATGDGASNAYTVSNGSETLSYTVYWNDQVGTSGSVQLSTGISTATQTGADTSSQTCSGGGTSNLEVRFAKSDILSKEAGTYSGVISLTVSPVL